MNEIVQAGGSILKLVTLSIDIFQGLNQLCKRYQIAQLRLNSLAVQVLAIQRALSRIDELIKNGTTETSQQLVLDLNTSLSFCSVLLQKMDADVRNLTTNGKLPESAFLVRLRTAFNGGPATEMQAMLDHQTNALTLLLTVFSCQTSREQCELLHEPESRSILESLDMAKDTPSLIMHRGSDSVFSFFTDRLSLLSKEFDFDEKLLSTLPYSAQSLSLISLLRQRLKKGASRKMSIQATNGPFDNFLPVKKPKKVKTAKKVEKPRVMGYLQELKWLEVLETDERLEVWEEDDLYRMTALEERERTNDDGCEETEDERAEENHREENLSARSNELRVQQAVRNLGPILVTATCDSLLLRLQGFEVYPMVATWPKPLVLTDAKIYMMIPSSNTTADSDQLPSVSKGELHERRSPKMVLHIIDLARQPSIDGQSCFPFPKHLEAWISASPQDFSLGCLFLSNLSLYMGQGFILDNYVAGMHSLFAKWRGDGLQMVFRVDHWENFCQNPWLMIEKLANAMKERKEIVNSGYQVGPSEI